MIAPMEDSIFSKIIRREIPAHIVYEDDATIAFLDIAPVRPGHTLVVPKQPTRNLFDADAQTLAAVMRTAQKVGTALLQALPADGMNVSINNERAAGQIVFHFHVHLIPRRNDDGLVSWPHAKYAPGEAEAVVEKIRGALGTTALP